LQFLLVFKLLESRQPLENPELIFKGLKLIL
jgi:hypothetical protein